MPRRAGDFTVQMNVTREERVLLLQLATKNDCATISQLLRLAVNALVLESGEDSLLFVDARPLGRPRLSKPRRFQAVGGYKDDTQYVEFDGSMVLVMKNGSRKPTFSYTLQKCLEFVRSGDWIEL